MANWGIRRDTGRPVDRYFNNIEADRIIAKSKSNNYDDDDDFRNEPSKKANIKKAKKMKENE